MLCFPSTPPAYSKPCHFLPLPFFPFPTLLYPSLPILLCPALTLPHPTLPRLPLSPQDDLLDRFDQVKVTAFLACVGVRRTEIKAMQEAPGPAMGIDLGPTAIANCEWTGAGFRGPCM